jgi:hypothetical protein
MALRRHLSIPPGLGVLFFWGESLYSRGFSTAFRDMGVCVLFCLFCAFALRKIPMGCIRLHDVSVSVSVFSIA